jgi:Rrf2 family iron-sulfur cluster assembly transcriptional regulator
MARLGKDGNPVSISTLAEDENISSVFLEQIFFKLRKAGIVSSVRGPGGGFRLAHPLNKLTVKQILDASGEDLAVTLCDKHKESCDREGGCVSHRIWVSVTALVNDYLSGITIASLLKDAEVSGKAGAVTDNAS